jgi:hypothetical protein
VVLVEGTLFVELGKVEDGRIGSMLEVGFGYFGSLVLEEAKDRKENIDDGEEPIAWCG